jgi:hypothetical protein
VLKSITDTKGWRRRDTAHPYETANIRTLMVRVPPPAGNPNFVMIDGTLYLRVRIVPRRPEWQRGYYA